MKPARVSCPRGNRAAHRSLLVSPSPSSSSLLCGMAHAYHGHWHRFCDGCHQHVAFMTLARHTAWLADAAAAYAAAPDAAALVDVDEETGVVGCSVHPHLRWHVCRQCPDLDFCAECVGGHAHACVPGAVHAPEDTCAACALGSVEP
jgi:hypothetical protein